MKKEGLYIVLALTLSVTLFAMQEGYMQERYPEKGYIESVAESFTELGELVLGPKGLNLIQDFEEYHYAKQNEKKESSVGKTEEKTKKQETDIGSLQKADEEGQSNPKEETKKPKRELTKEQKETVEQTFATAKEINRHSNLPEPFMKKLTLPEDVRAQISLESPYIDWDKEEEALGAMGYPYPAADSDVYYSSIQIEQFKYHVYGIFLGTDMDKADEVLTSYGYSVLVENENMLIYEKGDVYIILIYNPEDNKILNITITAYSDIRLQEMDAQ